MDIDLHVEVTPEEVADIGVLGRVRVRVRVTLTLQGRVLGRCNLDGCGPARRGHARGGALYVA